MWTTATRIICQDVKMFLHLLKRRGYNPQQVISLLAEPGLMWHRFKPQPQQSLFTFQPSVMLTGCLCAWLESCLGEAPRNCPIGEGGVYVQPWCDRDQRAAAALCHPTSVQGLCWVPLHDSICPPPKEGQCLYHHLPFHTFLRGWSAWDPVRILHLKR